MKVFNYVILIYLFNIYIDIFLEFKTPLESFEWNFEREKDPNAIIEFTNNENTEHNLSS